MVVQRTVRGYADAFKEYLRHLEEDNVFTTDTWLIYNSLTDDVDAVTQTSEPDDQDEAMYGRVICYDGQYYLSDMMAVTSPYMPVSTTTIKTSEPYIDTAEHFMDFIREHAEMFNAYIGYLKVYGVEYKVNPVLLISNLSNTELMGLSVMDNRLLYIRNYKEYGNIHEVYDMRLIELIDDYDSYNIADQVMIVPPMEGYINRYATDLGLCPNSWKMFGGDDMWQHRERLKVDDDVVTYFANSGHKKELEIYRKAISTLNRNCVKDMKDPEFYAFLEYRTARLERYAKLDVPWVIFEDGALKLVRQLIA